MEIWRWIPPTTADGATHMALDAVLAEGAEEFGRPTFRLYRWSPWCLSIGVHQSVSAFDLGTCRQYGIDVVRRPTGGRAVFHAEEITYAVCLPPAYRQMPIAGLHRWIAEGLWTGLRRLGLPVEIARRNLDLRIHYRRPISASCFSAASRDEILLGGRKLVGSAQRRFASGILQHGSILLGDAHVDLPLFFCDLPPEQFKAYRQAIAAKSISIYGYLGREIDFAEAVEALRMGMEKGLEIRLVPGGLTPIEEARAQENRDPYTILTSQEKPVLSVRRGDGRD